MSADAEDDAGARLTRLEREMVRCIGGDFDARLTVTERSDDLDAIATGINILLDEVQHAMREADHRRAAEAALQKQAVLFEAIQDAVIVVGPEGRVVAWNGASCASFGLQPDEAINGPPFPMLGDKEARALERRVSDALVAQGVWHGEVEVERTPGEMRTYQATVVPVSGEVDEVVGRVQIFRDITESRLLEQRVQHAERLKSLGVLAGGVAHDFNNQLAGIQTAAEVLSKLLGADKEGLSTYVESILLASRRAADLTEQLLAFARRGPMRREPVDVNQLVTEVSELVRRGGDKRILVSLTLSDTPLRVLGDSSQLQNVLLNIAFNARDAMPQGGELFITTEVLADAASGLGDRDGQAEPVERVRVILRDTGVGMPESVAHRMFEPFFTTKPQGEGVGMGLSTVFGVVEAHGGEIEVMTEEGRGTMVTIDLPLTQALPEGSPHTSSGAGLSEHGGGAHVLIVDDEVMILSLVQEALELEGYRVRGFQRGHDALEYFAERAQEVDAVILDVMMPGLSGGEVLRRMQRIDPNVAVVLCSGFSKDDEIQRIDLPALRFMQKPYPLSRLMEALKDVILLRAERRANRLSVAPPG